MTLSLKRDDAMLLVIDIQQKLAPHIEGHAGLIRRSEALMQAAAWFGIQRRATEHCPEQIGPIIEPLRSRFTDAEIIRKAAFGATDEPAFLENLRGCRRGQVVVTGMEAHVCVLQTVLGLRQRGLRVFVVGDAVGSRVARQQDRALALQRMQQAGATLVSTESVLFEWTQRADDVRFGEVLALVKSLSRPA